MWRKLVASVVLMKMKMISIIVIFSLFYYMEGLSMHGTHEIENIPILPMLNNYVILIQVKLGDRWQTICSGFIHELNQGWIVTTAECAKMILSNQKTHRIAFYSYKNKDKQLKYTHLGKGYYMKFHHEYQHGKEVHNIAMFKNENDTYDLFQTNLPLIGLEGFTEDIIQQAQNKVWAVGFPDPANVTIQAAEFELVRNEYCNFYPQFYAHYQICLRRRPTLPYRYYGLSGTPLLIFWHGVHTFDKRILHGMMSYSIGKTDFPEYFPALRVHSYEKWANNVIQSYNSISPKR